MNEECFVRNLAHLFGPPKKNPVLLLSKTFPPNMPSSFASRPCRTIRLDNLGTVKEKEKQKADKPHQKTKKKRKVIQIIVAMLPHANEKRRSRLLYI